MLDISLPVAFVAGVASVFAPCVVPLLPVYVAYVTGITLTDLKKHNDAIYQRRLLLASLFYVLGFSLIFIMLGLAAAGIGGWLRHYQSILQIIGGILITIFGLELAGIINLPLLARGKMLILPAWTARLGYGRPLLIGMLFALVWAPCVGVILGAILTIAAVQGQAFLGVQLLFVYSLGISLPFILISLTLGHLHKYWSFVSQSSIILSRASGFLLLMIGVLLMTNTYKYVNNWIFALLLK
ncbi:sulfite exporter TauE/SafE family protein [Candidatus Microgenomates bacterium]|nr:sulfite exporter TauE/SafE family protein [Candidatus Microgenomates bacterium]